jgi:BlaI family penicillinase repressor
VVEHLQHKLSRRERQIMDALFRLGEGSVADVRDNMPNAPGYSAVRAQLRILEEKGHVTHTKDGPRYVYRPEMSLERAKRSAVTHVAETFFGGSAVQMMASLLDARASDLSEVELDRLSRLIEQARTEERRGGGND